MQDSTTITTTRTGLTSPAWATNHEVDDSVNWSREFKMVLAANPTHAEALPRTLAFLASTRVYTEVQDGEVVLVRPADVEYYIEDEIITADEARRFAAGILSVVDAVEAATS